MLTYSFSVLGQIKEITTIEPDSLNFSDLSFLKSTLQGVRIIGLGEQMHYDGATYNAKVRLIKYLHENLGYNVIAFESGLYDCTVANDAISKRKLTDSVNYLNDAIFGIWDCKEVYALAEYIDKTNKTNNPLILTGFDIQFAGDFARDSLAKEFIKFIKYIEIKTEIDLKIDSIQLINSITTLAMYSNYFNKIPEQDTLFLQSTIAKIEATFNKNKSLRNSYTSYWLRVLENIKSDYRKRYFSKVNIRDSMMASNITWLTEERFKDQKIILWSANTHLARNTNSVKNKYLKNNKLMGNYLSDYFDTSYYFIAFTSYEGRFFNSWLLYQLSKKKPKKKSIEKFMYKKGYNYSFLDLRNNSISSQLDYKHIHYSKIFGNSNRKMNLSKVVDGVFYIRYMYPKTY